MSDEKKIGTEELSESDLEAVAGGIEHVLVPQPIGIIRPIELDPPILILPMPLDKITQ
jgi:hypothetical protein